MDQIAIELEARDLAANRLRSWWVEAGPDLFGVWIATVHFGRIGTAGRAIRHNFNSETDARSFVRSGLRRRQTAKRRIGVPYRLIEASPDAVPLLEMVGLTAATSSLERS